MRFACSLFLFVLAAGAWSLAGAAEPKPGPAREPIRERLAEKSGGTRVGQPSAGNGQRELSVGNAKRTFLLHVPKDRPESKLLPLVIVLHGAMANGGLTAALTNFDAVADKHAFVVAYPNGVGSLWNFWDDGKSRHTPGKESGDVAFLAKLIDTLVEEKLVDARRVYATGMSNGAFMSNNLGVTLSDKIAAIAPVAGTIPKILAEPVKPPRAMPVLYIHGTSDKIVGINGVDTFTKKDGCLPAADLAAWWAKHNGCDLVCKKESLPSRAQDGTQVKRHTYAAGKQGAPVVFYEVVNGGHTWPGGRFQPEFLLGKTSQQFNASEVIWEFFSQYALK